MATIRPFFALRPTPGAAPQVAAPPYDVVSADEARELAQGNPESFLHVSRAEIDLPADLSPYDARVYEQAKAAFEGMRAQGILLREPEAALYLYRLERAGRAQTGIAGAFSLDEYDSGRIKRHELTRPEKEDDRTRHIAALGAQSGPILLAYRADARLDRLVREGTAEAPLYDFTAADGVRHTLWKLEASASASVAEAFRAVPELYIADGHHRAASGARARRAANTVHHAGEPQDARDFVLGVAFPDRELSILAYNRLLRDQNGRSVEEIQRALEALGLEPNGEPEPARKGEVSVYWQGRWHRLPLRAESAAGPLDGLDASLLERQVFRPIFGVRDIRNDPRVEFVGGIRGSSELKRRVDRGDHAIAFALYPVSMEELFAVSDRDEIMPPKSTWFEPKLRDGLLTYLL